MFINKLKILISEYWIISTRPENFLVIAGANDNTISDDYESQRNVLKVKEIILYPGYIYKNGSTLHDIGILVLESPIPMIKGATEPVKLAEKDLPLGTEKLHYQLFEKFFQ